MNAQDPIIGHTICAAEVYSDHVFMFVLESILPDTGRGAKGPPKTVIACYDAMAGTWQTQTLPHTGTRYVSSTGAMPPTDHASIFFTKSNPGEDLNAVLYECTYDGTLTVQATDVVARDDIAVLNDALHIDGAFFVCGNQQTVVQRRGPNAYNQLNFKDGGRSVRKHENWDAIGGYSPTDIYTTGKCSDSPPVTHYDGTTWRSCATPDDLPNYRGCAVACAPDNTVYIMSRDGDLLRGNATDGFEQIATTIGTVGEMTDGFTLKDHRALAWFNGRLYLSLNWLYVLDGTRWTPVVSGTGHQPLYFENLATNGTILLQFNTFSASFFDGTTWHDIRSQSKTLTDMVNEGKLPRHLKWVHDAAEIQAQLETRVHHT